MSYANNQSFLADKVYKISEANRGAVIIAPNGSRFLVLDTKDDQTTGYQAALC